MGIRRLERQDSRPDGQTEKMYEGRGEPQGRKSLASVEQEGCSPASMEQEGGSPAGVKRESSCQNRKGEGDHCRECRVETPYMANMDTGNQGKGHNNLDCEAVDWLDLPHSWERLIKLEHVEMVESVMGHEDIAELNGQFLWIG